jgi:hypothetical protein
VNARVLSELQRVTINFCWPDSHYTLDLNEKTYHIFLNVIAYSFSKSFRFEIYPTAKSILLLELFLPLSKFDWKKIFQK